MHGRVKVRSTEEEKIRKEKERQAKLLFFRNVMGKIQNKRKDGALDKEMLEYTGQLLAANPDINTLWNIRREALQVLCKECEDPTIVSKLYDSELYLTENCLKVNPKSYGAWHQREWVLSTRTDPDWKNELALCNLYLKYDERNFHVWDYRRFVVSHYKTLLEDEFKYTTEKIYENFSNYSAWHYRSKMLTQLYPDREGGRPIADTQHKNELEIVQSAAFTDPDDTSAWFYQRWLLGAVKTVRKMMVASVTPQLTTVAFNTSLRKAQVSESTKLFINNAEINGEWKSISGKEYDFVWIFKHFETILENLDIKITFEGANQVLELKNQQPLRYVGKGQFNFRNHYSQPVIEELNKQLESCHQLLQLEPDSKWTLLTTTVIMHCCDPADNLSNALQNLSKLKQIDKLRSGYYDDLASKWIIEEYLEKHCTNPNPILTLKSLFSHKITALYHLQYFSACTVVDFSNQNLTSRVLAALVFLQNCEDLNLENNSITHLKSFPILPSLKRLVLKENDLTDAELQKFKNNYANKIELIL